MINRNRKIIFNQPIQITGLEENMDGSLKPITTTYPTPGILIPFSTGGLNNTGVPSSNIILSSFSMPSSQVALSDNTFTQTASQYLSFIMPCHGTLQSIAMSAVSNSAFTGTVNPYVAIATAPTGSFNFTINPNTKVEASFSESVVVGGTSSNYQPYLNLFIPAGTRVAIVCGVDTTTQAFNYNGALFFKRG